MLLTSWLEPMKRDRGSRSCARRYSQHGPRHSPSRRLPRAFEALEDRTLLTGTAEIHGIKFNDLDGDGQFEPGAGEAPLEDWEIFLDLNNNGVLDDGEPSQLTDANGQYAFTNLDAGSYTVAEVLQPGWTQTSPINVTQISHPMPDPTNQFNDGFGNRMIAVGGNILVSASSDDTAGSLAGAVYLIDGTTGDLLHQFLSPLNPDANSARFGTTLAAFTGGPFDDDVLITGFDRTVPQTDPGRVYHYDTGTGDLLRTFVSPNPSIETGAFGSSIAAEGNLVLIGAEGSFFAGNQTPGVAYLFDATTGELLQKFLPPTSASEEDFGRTVALADGKAVIGSGIRDEAVYVFDEQTGLLLHTIQNPDAGADLDGFGSRFVADGNNLLIANSGDDTVVPNAGAAYLFDVTTGELLQSFHNPSPSATESNSFGGTLAIQGDIVVVGDFLDDTQFEDSGAAYIFDAVTGELFNTILNPTVDGEQMIDFPRGLALIGDQVFISFPRVDDGEGAVFVYPTLAATQQVVLIDDEVRLDVDFGNRATSVPGEIRGMLYDDIDGDGLFETGDGETPLENWEVYLDLNENGVLDAGEPSQFTDANGQYAFTGLAPRTYVVGEVIPAGWEQTSPDIGPTVGPRSDLYITSGDTVAVLRGDTVLRTWNTVHSGEYPIAVGRASSTAPDIVSLGNAVAGAFGNTYNANGTPGAPKMMNSFGGYTSFYDAAGAGFSYALDQNTGDVKRYSNDFQGTDAFAIFSLGGDEVIESGIAVDLGRGSLWISDRVGGTNVTEYSLNGEVLSSFSTGHEENTNLAFDPADETLWLQNHTDISGPLVFEQYSRSGELLQTVTYASLAGMDFLGGEFDFTTPRDPPDGGQFAVVVPGGIVEGVDFGNRLAPPPTVTLDVTGSPFAENSGAATVTATLSHVWTDDVTVNLSFAGTATNMDDYTRSAESIVISAGSLSGSITLTGVDDADIDPTESVVVDITSVSNGVEDGTQQVTATIDDDEIPPGPAEISVTDNSGAIDDAQVRFSTPLSQYRTGADDSFYVRPGFADSAHYIDITNSGDAPLTLFEIQINAPDVTTDITLTSSAADDILLAPGAVQRVHLNYAPTLPIQANPQGHDFLIPAGLVILSNAATAPTMEVSLQGASTFASDLTYDGSVNFGDLGVFNVNFGLNSQSPGWDPTADVTGDGAVNFGDLGTFNVEFGLQLQQSPSESAMAKFPGAADTTVGDFPWDQPENSLGNTPGSAASVEVDRNEFSDPLRLTNFSFNIPVGAEISGIEVTLLTTGSDEPTGGHGVSLAKNGSQTAAATNVVAGSWSTGSITIGGASELWGTSWTAAELNSANFGLIIQIEAGSNNDSFQLLTAEVNVVFTISGTSTAKMRKGDPAAENTLVQPLEIASETNLKLRDDEDSLATEIARRMYFSPQATPELQPANALRPYDAVYEQLGDVREGEEELDWLFDFDANTLAEAMLIV